MIDYGLHHRIDLKSEVATQIVYRARVSLVRSDQKQKYHVHVKLDLELTGCGETPRCHAKEKSH